MAESLPSASNAADAVDEETPQVPSNAEDRKAAAALNSLNANEISQDNGEGTAKQPSAADQEALGKAMSRLEIANGGGKKEASKKVEEKKKEEAEVKKKIKVAAEDVALLVEELDLSRVKATELLRSHEGDAIKAMKAFITPPPVKV